MLSPSPSPSRCPQTLSMDNELKIVFWNVRGLNSKAKRTAVRSVVSSVSPSIVCFSEKKLASISPKLIFETLGPPFADFFWLPMAGTRGRILLAWRGDHVMLSNPNVGSYHVSAVVTTTPGVSPWWITGVYGPQSDADKLAFVSELHDLCNNMAGPWLLGGDFNLVTSIADKNNGQINHRTLSKFRRFITDHGLRDIYLHGRRYTWSNEQSNPTLIRNDRVLYTPSWEFAHPEHILRCLVTATSDHCPLVIDCSHRLQGKRRFHFKHFRIKLEGFLQTVDEA